MTTYTGQQKDCSAHGVQIKQWYICACLPTVLPSFMNSLVSFVSRHYGTFLLLQKPHHVEPQRKVSFTLPSALACDCFICCPVRHIMPRWCTARSYTNCIQCAANYQRLQYVGLGCDNPCVGHSLTKHSCTLTHPLLTDPACLGVGYPGTVHKAEQIITVRSRKTNPSANHSVNINKAD